MLRVLIVSFSVLIASFSLSAKEINSVDEIRQDFQQAELDACFGKSLGASCTIEFPGGSVSVGVCVELPNSSPVGGQLSCQLNIPELHGCSSSATGKGAVVPMLSLAGLLIFLRVRRRQA